MDLTNFLKILDWIDSYRENLPTLDVNPSIVPGAVLQQLPTAAPEKGETFDQIFKDFESMIVPNMTHWQHPDFYAYFPASNSLPSLEAELLTAALGAQCMLWVTSPAAEELEIRMMEWLRSILDLPSHLTGCIQDTASSATLCAILSARELHSDFGINEYGFQGQRFRVYTSTQAHSSVEKAVKISGIGAANLVKIAVDENYALIPESLESAIKADLDAGFSPLIVIGTIGTTSTTAIDPIEAIGKIASKYKLWFHVDAAYAGTALILPQCRWMSVGLEYADSFVFNPHKWMFTHFDCSAYYVKDPLILRQTFGIQAAYLRSAVDENVANFRDWGIALGRRFRALKLWFVMRSFGVEGIRDRIRAHISLGKWFQTQIEAAADFELMAPVVLNLVCFRFVPKGICDLTSINKLNKDLLEELNRTGKIFLTPTDLNGQYVIRLVPGNEQSNMKSLQAAWERIKEMAESLDKLRTNV